MEEEGPECAEGGFGMRMNEYKQRGDYHRSANSCWAYEPIYKMKLDLVRDFMSSISKDKLVYDLGCGEGVLVNEFRSKGYKILGFDLNYSSDCVRKADIRNLHVESGMVDVVIILDVLEHLDYIEQHKVLDEIYRILKPGGRVLFGLPNIAHFVSRLSFLVRGKLIRTSVPERHLGDRSLFEWRNLLRSHGFRIVGEKGIFPTFPLTSWLRMYYPQYFTWLPSLVSRIPVPVDWCFEVLVEVV